MGKLRKDLRREAVKSSWEAAREEEVFQIEGSMIRNNHPIGFNRRSFGANHGGERRLPGWLEESGSEDPLEALRRYILRVVRKV
jgi:hypothetical protein